MQPLIRIYERHYYIRTSAQRILQMLAGDVQNTKGRGEDRFYNVNVTLGVPARVRK